MANDKEITIKVRLDGTKGVIKDSAKVKHSIRDIGDEADSSKKNMKGFGIGTAAAGALAVGALTQFGQVAMQAVKASFRLATSAEETASKYRTVLGPNIDQANEYLQENATKMGLSNTAGQDMIATTTAIAEGFGYSGEAAADMGLEVVSLAGDLQSFHDVPIEQTHNAITSALSGETEALKSLGIVIRQEMVTQKAMNQTGKDSVEALTQQERATATMALITEKAGVAIGDLNRTQDSTANQARQVAAEFENLQINMAQKLMPAFGDAVGLGGDLVSMLNDWVDVPLSEELQNERLELNTLVSQITDANIAQDKRNQLIARLQSDYPDFLENLDIETVTNKELAERLEDVNQAYLKQIAIQAQAEATADARAELSGTMADAFSKEMEMRREVIALNEKYDLGLKTNGVTIQELVKSTREVTESMGLWGNTRVFDTINRLGADMGRLRDLQEDVDVANENLSEQMNISGKIAERYNVSLSKITGESEAGASAAEDYTKQLDLMNRLLKGDLFGDFEAKGEDIEFSTSIDDAGLQALPTTDGEEIKVSQIEKFKKNQKIKQAAREKEIAFIQRISALRAEAPKQTALQAAGIKKNTQLVGLQKEEYIALFATANQGFQLLSSLMASISARRLQDMRREKEQRLENINAELAQENITEAQKRALIQKRAAVEEKYQKKIAKQQRKQFRIEKQAKLAEIAMNTAVAVSKAWGQTGIFGIAAQIPVLIMGAAQAAIVASQPNPYLFGGELLERLPEGMTSPGEKVISINENGRPEFIVNAESTRQMLPLLEYGNSSPAHAEAIMNSFQPQRFENGGPLGPVPKRPKSFSPSAGIDTNAIAQAAKEGIESATIVAVMQDSLEDLSERLENLEQYNNRYNP